MESRRVFFVAHLVFPLFFLTELESLEGQKRGDGQLAAEALLKQEDVA